VPDDALISIAGHVPLVLVAPHGGRRDPSRDPWRRGGLRTNDLHTADLTLALARTTGAAAIVNDVHDRNRVDLNRVDQTVDRLPAFLEAIGDALAHAIDRHGHATLLTVHGWNTTAPAIDLGLGCRPGRELGGERPGPAVTRTFATRALPAFGDACARRGLAVSVGRRYPARARQNLIQLFTGRWRADTRHLVARVARLGPRCDAMQLELGIPLRWPGPWRDAFVAAFRDAAPALLDPERAPLGAPPSPPLAAARASAHRLDFVSHGVCGMAAIDARGGRLLLVGLHVGLDLFTHERVGDDDADAVGALGIRRTPDGAELTYRGPISRFPDTDAFLDLEAGLAGARLAHADVSLAFRRAHPATDPCPFGDVAGRVTIADRTITIDGPAFFGGEDAQLASAWFDLGRGRRVALYDDGEPALLCEEGRHRRVRGRLVGSETHASIAFADAAACGNVTLAREHSIPIVRGRSRPATSLALGTYRRDGRRAGWGQWTASRMPPTPADRQARPDA
jgi:hypothetical protein